MPAVATRSMIRREIGDDRVCLLTFDRPESGANIFDAATMSELSEHVDAIEANQSLHGLIIDPRKNRSSSRARILKHPWNKRKPVSCATSSPNDNAFSIRSP